MNEFQEKLLAVLQDISEKLEIQNSLIYEDLRRKYPEHEPSDEHPLSMRVGSNPEIKEILQKQLRRGS